MCGHTAGIMARSDQERDAWFSPTGFNRGQIIRNCKLSFNPNQMKETNYIRRELIQ